VSAADPAPIVVKVGGGMLADAGTLDRVLETIAAHGPGRAVVVPGGGPFADAVRDVARRLAVGDDSAHWMAILAMEQYGNLIAGRLAGAVVARDAAAVAAALRERAIPVVAPHAWMREADPLPHSWDVTSDSIAAWLAGAVGARLLVLVKPAAGDIDELADPWLRRALPAGIDAAAVAATDTARLAELLG
jgi:aspartokinase-like uncharacterized kinase